MYKEEEKVISSAYKKKQINDLVPGDIILHPLYRSDGLMLINRNKEISSSLLNLIRRQADLSIPVLVVSNKEKLDEILDEEIFSNPEFLRDLKEVISEYNKRTNTPISVAAFMQEAVSDIDDIQKRKTESNYFSEMLSKQPLWQSLDQKLESQKLTLRSARVKNELLKLMMGDKTFKNLFEALIDYDDILFINSINATCISLMIGLSIELNDNELIDLAVAALFSNIGFLEMSKKEFKKFLKADDLNQEPIKNHLEIFSKMTFDSSYLRKKPIIYGILDHHEYYNGNGYPNGKKGEEISLYGRILNIAQTYDDLVGGYKYTDGLLPFQSLKLIYENKENRFDQDILNVFIDRTNYFKLGEKIVLPNRLMGEIIDFDDFLKYPHLPVIKLDNGKTLNLFKYLSK